MRRAGVSDSIPVQYVRNHFTGHQTLIGGEIMTVRAESGSLQITDLMLQDALDHALRGFEGLNGTLLSLLEHNKNERIGVEDVLFITRVSHTLRGGSREESFQSYQVNRRNRPNQN